MRLTLRHVDLARRVARKRFTQALWRGGKLLARACEGWRPRARRYLARLLAEGDALAARPEPIDPHFSPPLFTGRVGAAGASWAPRDHAADWRHLRSEFPAETRRDLLLAHEAKLKACRDVTRSRGGLGLALSSRVPFLRATIADMRRVLS